MSVALALLFLALVVVVKLTYSARRAPQPRPVLVKRYVHPGHAWLKVDEDGYVVVGIDEFGQSVIGSIDEVKLPRILRRVRQGEVGWTIRHGERELPMRSPVSGWVVEKNEMVLNDPSLVNDFPYGDGWLFKVKPAKLEGQLHNLLTGKAVARWVDQQRAELARLFSGTPALMYQDGGVMLRDLADRCSDEEWDSIAREFFLVRGKEGASS